MAVTPVASLPFPKSHSWATTVPSMSDEPDPSTATVSKVGVTAKEAAGARLDADPVVPIVYCRATAAALSGSL